MSVESFVCVISFDPVDSMKVRCERTHFCAASAADAPTFLRFLAITMRGNFYAYDLQSMPPMAQDQEKKVGVYSKDYLIKEYRIRLRDNLQSLNENFARILTLVRVRECILEGEASMIILQVDEEVVDSRAVNRTLYYEQINYEVQARVANMVNV